MVEKLPKKKPAHYVSNADFLAAIKEYRILVLEAKEKGLEKPQITNYLGECILRLRLTFPINRTSLTTRIVMIWCLMGLKTVYNILITSIQTSQTIHSHTLHKSFGMHSSDV